MTWSAPGQPWASDADSASSPPSVPGDEDLVEQRGIGKPEALRHVPAGYWSRRIDEEHRLVHLVDGDDVVILQARYHYDG